MRLTTPNAMSGVRLARLIALSMLVAVLVMLVAAPAARAGDTRCPPALIGGTYDNVVVPPGEHCVISSAKIEGNVKVLEDAGLFMASSTVRGNVEGDKADSFVIVGASRVDGNIQAKEGAPPRLSSPGGVRICGTLLPKGNIEVEKFREAVVFLGGSRCEGAGGGNQLIKGNIKVEENHITRFGGVLALEIAQNEVGGILQVFKNTGEGAKTVNSNTHFGNLQCKENDNPFVGGPNNGPGPDDPGDQCFD